MRTHAIVCIQVCLKTLLAFIIDYDGKTTIEYMSTIITPYMWNFLQYINFTDFVVTYKYSKNLINETLPVRNICTVYQDFQDVLDDNLHSKYCYTITITHCSSQALHKLGYYKSSPTSTLVVLEAMDLGSYLHYDVYQNFLTVGFPHRLSLTHNTVFWYGGLQLTF